MIKYFLIFFNLLFFCCNIFANNIGSDSKFKIPRFVSLKSDNSNLRIGSSTNYPIKLNYIRKNMPLEIVEENKYWRKINDIEGNIGWIHKTLLQGDRYGIINNKLNSHLKIFSFPGGKIIGKIGNANIAKLEICMNLWCKINYNTLEGWVEKKNIWGVYKNEKFNIPFYQPLFNKMWEFYSYLIKI